MDLVKLCACFVMLLVCVVSRPCSHVIYRTMGSVDFYIMPPEIIKIAGRYAYRLKRFNGFINISIEAFQLNRSFVVLNRFNHRIH